MKNDLKILESLTQGQRQEFENDLRMLYQDCYEQMNGDLEKLKDVVANINLQDEIFLNVIFEFDKSDGKKGKGRVTHLSRYPNRLTYEAAIGSERNRN